MFRIEGMTPQLFPDAPRESRTGSRPRNRRVSRGGARRRRARGPEKAPQLLLDYWNEHAVKTGMVVFVMWFTAANWTGLRGLPGQVLAAFG